MKRLWMKMYGQVQGVGLRFSAARKARELGLVGFVRNCDDGCVETDVEGEDEKVEKYRQWCKKGPTFAHVVKAEEKWGEVSAKYSTFEIQ